MTAGKDRHRQIRSYVRREGRITSGQQKALERHWTRYGIDFSRAPIDLPGVFGRTAPLVLDIGTGMGETTVAMASARPDNNYLAVEVHRPGVGSLLRQVHRQQLANVRVINHDVVEVLRYQVPANSVDMVCLFFPDPWPKKRHHKRRLVNSAFLDLLLPCLKDNCRLFIATDWEDYAEQILEMFSCHGGFFNLAGDSNPAPRPRWRPRTKFETRGGRLSHKVHDFFFAKR